MSAPTTPDVLAAASSSPDPVAAQLRDPLAALQNARLHESADRTQAVALQAEEDSLRLQPDTPHSESEWRCPHECKYAEALTSLECPTCLRCPRVSPVGNGLTDSSADALEPSSAASVDAASAAVPTKSSARRLRQQQQQAGANRAAARRLMAATGPSLAEDLALLAACPAEVHRFVAAVYTDLRAANAETKHCERDEHRCAIDALSILTHGDEVCGAVSYDAASEKLLAATNGFKNQHSPHPHTPDIDEFDGPVFVLERELVLLKHTPKRFGQTIRVRLDFFGRFEGGDAFSVPCVDAHTGHPALYEYTWCSIAEVFVLSPHHVRPTFRLRITLAELRARKPRRGRHIRRASLDRTRFQGHEG